MRVQINGTLSHYIPLIESSSQSPGGLSSSSFKSNIFSDDRFSSFYRGNNDN